jgi:hypothetical protein
VGSSSTTTPWTTTRSTISRSSPSDDGLGLLDFLPVGGGGAFDAMTVVGPFVITSALAPSGTTFDALTVNGDFLNGRTRGPIGSAVPEPTTAVLSALGLFALGCRKRRPPDTGLRA